MMGAGLKRPPEELSGRDTNLVWDSGTQSGTGNKSGTRNVYQFLNDCKSNLMTLFTFW